MSENSNNGRTFPRFDVVQRIEHFFLLLSFTLLAITGLVQKYPETGISQAVIRGLGGIEITRSIHHASAIVLIVLSIFHFIHVGYRLYVLRREPGMLPTFKDVKDAIQAIAYNLGLSQERPKMGYYNFGEKIEYWAVVWGTVIMAITGYMLWNPIVVTRYLPGEVIPAAKMAHGFEAILAVLSILTWHVWHVHLKYFNRSIFTGRISYHEMEEEHGEALEKMLKGEQRPEPPVEEQWRRARVYVPIAGALILAFLLLTYRFFTLEQTAITTLPPRQVEEVYVPAQPPGLPTATPAAMLAELEIPQRLPLPTPEPPVITSHPVDEARQDCLACHGVYSMIAPAPLEHLERIDEDCLSCHTASQEVARQ